MDIYHDKFNVMSIRIFPMTSINFLLSQKNYMDRSGFKNFNLNEAVDITVIIMKLDNIKMLFCKYSIDIVNIYV